MITSDDILGKDVLDKDGELIGVIQQLHIDKNEKKIVGITIDEGFMKPDLFVGIEHIKTFGIDSVILSISPNQKFIGLLVYDCDGKQVGKIKNITMGSRHRIKAITVHEGILRNIIIPSKEIKEIGYNAILKKSYVSYTESKEPAKEESKETKEDKKKE